MLESLDTLEGDVDAECTEMLGELLHLFGAKETGGFLLSALDLEKNQGLRSRTVEMVRARILMALDRDEEAERALLEILNGYPPDKHVHYYLATVYDALKRFEPTEEHLLTYLQMEPDDPDALNFLGYLYAVQNVKLDEAERLLKRALELDPENGFYLDSLGWVYYRKGDGPRAVELIRRALLAMDNDDAEVRDHLGDAYLLNGDTERAVEEWERARRLDPKREGLKEKIDQHREKKE
jgi:tetratricopeptide (TPR) repeat protein